MSRRVGSENAASWDVVQADEIDIDEALRTLGQVGTDLAAALESLRDSQAVSQLLQVSPAQRALAGGRALAQARTSLDRWTRVLAELAVAEGAPQRATADALGISTNTLSRWLKDPIGFNWAGAEE